MRPSGGGDRPRAGVGRGRVTPAPAHRPAGGRGARRGTPASRRESTPAATPLAPPPPAEPRIAGYPPVEEFFPPRLTLPAMRQAAQGCRGCPLFAAATQAVFGEGPAQARLMLVGEQPGDQEDRAGRPFVGAAGRLLDQLLDEAGIDRAAIYLTNVVKHFKHEERGRRRIHKKPGLTEVRACFPWFRAEVARIAPQLIVCLGATAARAVLGTAVSVQRDHGRIFDGELAPLVMATYHPSAVLRAPDDRRAKARADLLADLQAAASRLATTH
jgi:uracil-DNA glycosylase